MKEVELGVKLRKGGQRMPTVLSCGEVKGLLGRMRPRYHCAAALQYGGGLRLGELVGLRIKDLDPEHGVITVRSAKGDKDRTTILSA
jgi:site-specific recombinase XerD